MASIAIHFSIFFLFSLLSSFHLHARDSHFFNKMPRNNVVNKEQTTLNPQEQQPNFLQESENGGYGLYGRESTTAAAKNLPVREEEIPNKKYLPKNYNPVSYVTVPEDTATASASAGEKNQYYGGGKQKTTMPSDTFMQSGYTNSGENYFNNQKESFPSTTTTGNRYDQYNGGDANGVKEQGMSDTRFLDGGRYYYNGERFPRNPLDNSRNEFGNSRNFKENNNNFMENSYQNEEFEDEDDDLP